MPEDGRGPAMIVRGLRVELADRRPIVDDISFEIGRGEILCLIGESGSGKTTVSTALLGHVRAGASIAGGEVIVDGGDVLTLRGEPLRRVRGGVIAYIAQDPAAAFNPAMRIGTYMLAVARAHGQSARGALPAAVAALADVGLPAPETLLTRFPHQLSGGQLQRVGIAIALLLDPKVIIFDEPTTGLDAATQARFLALVRKLCAERQLGVLYITHDLAVVARISDRTIVMLKGRAVEQGPARALFLQPAHHYSAQLLAAVPDVAAPSTARPSPGSASRLLEISGLHAGYGGRPILQGISFDVQGGECLAVVGESGSGKSTLSKSLIGLHPPYAGEVRLDGELLAPRARNRSAHARRTLQYVFQSPYTALNPRRTIGETVALAYQTAVGGSRADSIRAATEALEKVALPSGAAARFPRTLSGGERQRASIARALVCKPRLLICDEITSALDVVVQNAILDLLEDLRRSEGLTLLFVTHNLAVVRRIADRVLVLDRGQVAEIGTCGDILDRPGHPFTQGLLRETLSVSRTVSERWSAA